MASQDEDAIAVASHSAAIVSSGEPTTTPGVDNQPQDTLTSKPRQMEGRFIENISTDGSRDSAEGVEGANPTAARQMPDSGTKVPETEMVAASLPRPARQNSGLFRKSSKRQRINTNVQQPQQALGIDDHHKTNGQGPIASSETSGVSPTTWKQQFSADPEKHAKQTDKHSSSQESDDQEDKDEGEPYKLLAAIYPLSHFIGFRPISHPHTPADRRPDRHSPNFNRFHYAVGSLLSFGLPVSGASGEVARYRDPVTGKVHLARMYTDQAEAKLVNSFHSLIAAWVLIVLLAFLARSPFFRAHDAPLLIGAFGTEAVVTFFSYRIPLAQPKNILVGNAISAVIGVALSKAFQSTDYSVGGIDGDNWAAAATTVAVAVFGMQIVGCIHPPGAAIALLANISPSEARLGWYLVPAVVFSSLVVIGWALVINNLGGRRYPENWFYQGAFADPPIFGPEKLPYNNAPWELPRSRQRKRQSQRISNSQEPQEKAFYRVPQSGVKTTSNPIPRKPTGAASRDNSKGPASTTQYDLGRNAAAASSFPYGTGAVALPANEDGRTTRASEATRVGDTDASSPIQASQPAPETRADQATERGNTAKEPVSVPPSAAAASFSRPQTTSRLIEVEVVSRNNSKGSKKSKRSVVVHVNENPRVSTQSAPAVPAIQWREPDTPKY